MTRAWLWPLVALCGTALLPAWSHAAQTISVTGAVEQSGEFSWQPGVRLLNASVGARVADDAWYQGAALLRKSAVRDQIKLKTGLLFDLQAGIVNARALNSPATAELLSTWRQRIDGMPVTGRVQTEMNPLKQRLVAFNPLLEPGDQIIYPRRPSQVTVLGAVQQDCVLDFEPARDPLDYAADCVRAEAADNNRLYVIQPDGNVQSIGAAYWNAEDAWVAVGAVIYVPFTPALFDNSGDDFNTEMATWLATQYPLTGGYSE
jgi:hypothetical protein